ncbi:MAG: hypothetical protein QM767_29515 [Anaeromyxobacter sp.]
MPRRLDAKEQERRAARRGPPAPVAAPAGEALAMLARRGLHPLLARPDLPFPRDLDPAALDAVAERLGH